MDEQTEGPEGGAARDDLVDRGPEGDEGGGDVLSPMPGLIGTVSPPNMAMTVHAHMKELYAMAWDRENKRSSIKVDDAMATACLFLLAAFDDRRLSSVMANVASQNDLFDSYAGSREYALSGQA